jgi:Ca2+/H+ antiporter
LIFECFYSRTYGKHLYRNRTYHLVLIPAFTFSYFCWITYLFWQTPEDFPYRFLREMEAEGRLAFSVVSTVLSVYMYGLIMRTYVRFHAQHAANEDGSAQTEHESDTDTESEDENIPAWLKKSMKK